MKERGSDRRDLVRRLQEKDSNPDNRKEEERRNKKERRDD
tara:strand:+ start:299 stop:418 length:120 start_codon:yes stop_codon:yes gene_type:complete